MRQKDSENFANLLNRVRLGPSHFTEDDVDVLKAREIHGCDGSAGDTLHVFSSNYDVDHHNTAMLQKLGSEIRSITARDTIKGIVADKDKLPVSSKPSETGGLRECLSLGIGARVMLTKNIDVGEGLVNGVQGEVTGFVDTKCSPQEHSPPAAVLVKFDDEKVGQKRKATLKKSLDSVPIEMEEARFQVGKYSSSEVIRKQFPLTLSYASTIHKVQGLSMDKIVVTFDNYFQGGHAYVALSRCRSLEGLYLRNFDRKHLKVKKNVTEEMLRLQKKQLELLPTHSHGDAYISLCHLNIQSLAAHLEDLKACHTLTDCDVIGLSETWLHSGRQSEEFSLEGYCLIRKDRADMHKDCDIPDCGMCNNKGGVAVFVRSDISFQRRPDIEPGNLESIVISLENEKSDLFLVNLYRPPQLQLKIFQAAMKQIMSKISLESKVILMGDFNVDFSRERTVLKPLDNSNLVQLVRSPTHRLGSILDHVYVSDTFSEVQPSVIPQYYTDHSAVVCQIPVRMNSRISRTVRCGVQVEQCRLTNDSVATHSKLGLKQKQKQKVKDNTDRSAAKKSKSTSTNRRGAKKQKSWEPDIVCTGVEEPRLVVDNYIRPTEQDRTAIATQMGLELSNDPTLNPSHRDHSFRGFLQQHHSRSQIDVIRGDGNCFFRAISKELLGAESHHLQIRQVICDFMERHPLTFQLWFANGEFFPHVVRMRQDKEWATEIDLIATATYFSTTIWQFTNHYPVGGPWKWITLTPVEIHPEDPPFDGLPLHGCFYIHHTGGMHYDRILPPTAITM